MSDATTLYSRYSHPTKDVEPVERPYDPWRVYTDEASSVASMSIDSASVASGSYVRTRAMRNHEPYASNLTSKPPQYAMSVDGTTDESMDDASEELPDSSASVQSRLPFEKMTDYGPGSQASKKARSLTSSAPSRSMGSDGSGTSVISLTDSMRASMFKQEYGRELSTFNEQYQFPVDEEECDRQEKQHQLFIDLLGEKYPPRIVEVLSSDSDGRRRRVIDLGCGDGAWIKDVGKDFLNTLCVALDLVPMADTADIPDNVRSEVDDVNYELDHYYGEFDVVHVRLLAAGVKDYYRLIRQIARMLRPGGVVEIGEYDFHTYDKDRKRIDIDTSKPFAPPYFATMSSLAREAMIKLGGDVDAAKHLHRRVAGHPAFEDVRYDEFWLQSVGPKAENMSEEADAAMRFNMRSRLRSKKAMLLKSGVLDQEYEYLESHVDPEIEQGLITQYVVLQRVIATRNDVELPEFNPHVSGEHLI